MGNHFQRAPRVQDAIAAIEDGGTDEEQPPDNNHGAANDNVEVMVGKKRKRASDSDDAYSDFEKLLHTPKKKRLKSTSRYIYENLFLEGRESDITLSALNREWKLHKLYLSQSDYFSSMFNGNWRESNMKHVEITIVDPNITLDSMNTTLGSLYQDELSVEPADATSILGMYVCFFKNKTEKMFSVKDHECRAKFSPFIIFQIFQVAYKKET